MMSLLMLLTADGLCVPGSREGFCSTASHAPSLFYTTASACATASSLATRPAGPNAYAPSQDTVSFDGRPQRYRESKGKLQAALEDFSQAQRQQFVLTLGDIIDGHKDNPAKSSADLQMIAKMFECMLPGRPVYHLMGNHCLAAGRDELLKVGCAGKQSWVRPHNTSSSQSLLLFA
jgi:hypothetical protein